MPKSRKVAAGSAQVHRFPPERAFVVKLPAANLGSRPDHGRVEHVLSGRTGSFESLDQLAEFFAEVLAVCEQEKER
jgi:hypothetical protein